MSAASAMPLSCVTSRLYVPSRVAETLTRYWLPEPARFVTLPVPVPPEDSAKSPASTPVTSSLNVTSKTRVCAEVVSTAGSLLTIDATVGAVVSAGMVLTV